VIIDLKTADYLTKVIAEIEAGKGTISLVSICPECGETIDDFLTAAAGDGHLVYKVTSDSFAILIGCEGYWVTDPGLVGLERKGWTNPNGVEPVNDKGYPACPAATWENPHYLCFMERRDLDECPECGHPIPEELKLNDNMTGLRENTPESDFDKCPTCGAYGCIVDHNPLSTEE